MDHPTTNGSGQKRLPRRNCCWLGLLVLLTASLPLQAAVRQSTSVKVPRVSLGVVLGTPGTTLLLPFAFEGQPETPLRSLSVDIDFVSKSLTYQEISPGMASELVEAEIQATLTEGKVDEKGLKRVRLRVTASLPKPDAKEGLPDGVLAYLVFKVVKEAKPIVIKLTPTVFSATDLSTPPKKVSNVATELGLVTITGPIEPIFGCFFYMH